MIKRTFLFLVLAATSLHAEVVRIEVTHRMDLPGRSFGKAGEYEKLSGRIYFAVDPRNSANQIITDIDKAPANASGKVEFSADFYMLKPKEESRGNGTVLFEVSNRGGKGMVSFFNRDARGSDPAAAADLGDGFLMEQGFTLLWVGWQFDVPQRNGVLAAYVPIAREADGRPIQGLVRSDFVGNGQAAPMPLADRNHTPYEVVDVNDPTNVLTVRDCVDCPRRTLPHTQWKFTDDHRGVLVTPVLEKNKIYELVYKSQNPSVVGLGPAAIRDTISKFKYGAAPELSLKQGDVKRAIAFGISQSGRFLRTYLYYGFNEDESHRKVFDGVIPHVAGGGRGSFNHRFAQPSRDGHPYLNFFYPTDIFPFTDVVQRDPETGARDGLLTHNIKPELMPKVFYTNSSYEYWGRAASLFHTTVDGLEDAPMMPNVRAFLLTGGNHGVGGFPPREGIGQQLGNPLDYRWAMRSLLVSMNRWVTDGVEPPASAYPHVSNGELVAPGKLNFPKIPDVNVPAIPHEAYHADYGPEFATKGVVTQEPPKIGSTFPILVPQVNADGNETSGIRMPELAVPLATYTGWNLFNANAGPTDTLSSMQGSYIPFARTRADREKTNDPRPSVEERYQSRDEYLALVTKAANDLVAKGYLLKEDVSRIVEQAGTRWDYVMGKPGGNRN
jgi:Alpha/beta hydrolase domain